MSVRRLRAMPPLRSVRLRPWDAFTLYILRAHASRVFVVGLGLVSFGLAFDLANTLPSILARHEQLGTLRVAILIVWYCLLHSVRDMTDQLPLIGFLGVLWSECHHTISRERLALSSIGRSWVHYLVPTLSFAITIALVQFLLMTYLQPLAAQAQAKARLGDYLVRLDAQSTGPLWLVSGSTMAHAALSFGPPAVLTDLVALRLRGAGTLEKIVSAAEAEPTSGSTEWRLYHGTVTTVGTGDQPDTTTSFDTLTDDLQLNPIWLENFDIPAAYLKMGPLEDLASASLPPALAAEYRTALMSRFTEPVLAAHLVVLASALSLIFLRSQITINRVVLTGLAGYVVHAAGRQLLVLGQHENLPPFIAAWSIVSVVACALVATAGIAWLRSPVPTPLDDSAGGLSRQANSFP